MQSSTLRRASLATPLILSSALVLAACGSGSGSVAQQDAPPAADVPVAAPAIETEADTPATKQKPAAARSAETAGTRTQTQPRPAKAQQKKATATKTVADTRSAAERSADERIYDQKNGATDVGVTKESIKLGAINMHGMALGSVLIAPIVRGLQASYSSINDRGGVLGRRLQLVDCDDGPGEVSRAKACIKKLATSDHIFGLVGGASWSTASIHDDLKQQKLPFVGAWAYSQTEWQDPYMFPTHMSMIHEAMAGANWVRNVVKPKTYGLLCLTSPEMQLACAQVQEILDASGSKLAKKADVSISETSMSAAVLAMRAANPDHVIHYVINPATVAKFMVEAAQQNYYPPQGISGNHLAAEVLGSLFGKHPAGRYWANTTYKLWGPEFTSTINKYARANRGLNHHIVQASYVAANIFAEAAKAVGPNLTRERLMAQLGNGTIYRTDASLDQRFAYIPSERANSGWDKHMAQGREFMYKYTSPNTVANPDGSPSGFAPDPDQYVLYTWK